MAKYINAAMAMTKANITSAKAAAVVKTVEQGDALLSLWVQENIPAEYERFVNSAQFRLSVAETLLVIAQTAGLKQGNKLVDILETYITVQFAEIGTSAVDTLFPKLEEMKDAALIKFNDMFDMDLPSYLLSDAAQKEQAMKKPIVNDQKGKKSDKKKDNKPVLSGVKAAEDAVKAAKDAAPAEQEPLNTSGTLREGFEKQGFVFDDEHLSPQKAQGGKLKRIPEQDLKCTHCGDTPERKDKQQPKACNQLKKKRTIVDEKSKLLHPELGVPMMAFNGYGLCDTCYKQLLSIVADADQWSKKTKSLLKKFPEGYGKEQEDALKQVGKDLKELRGSVKNMKGAAKNVIESQIATLADDQKRIKEALTEFNEEFEKLNVDHPVYASDAEWEEAQNKLLAMILEEDVTEVEQEAPAETPEEEDKQPQREEVKLSGAPKKNVFRR